jgi:signal transduction histidine kinase
MTQPPLEHLERRPIPEVAAALRAAKAQILARWRSEVTALLPGADELTRRQLENSLPALIDQAANALAASNPDATERLIRLAPRHAETRFHQEFDLDELLAEYSILRRILFEEVSSQLRAPLQILEVVEIGQAIDIALREAAVAFADFQASEMRAEANAMTKYLAFLSHDLRGGINGALLLIEVLRREIGAEPKFHGSLEDLDTMRRLMMDTVGTMDRFLSAEKLRRGKMPVKVNTFPIAPLLNEVVRSFAYQSKERQIEMRVDANVDLNVTSDRELLMIVLHNLLSNAVKYTEKGAVEVRAAATPTPDVACRISVIDGGPGIAPDAMANLFAPFTRGETYGQKGVGLGLWMARQAADLIGAKLSVESKPGDGAKFHLDLPPTAPQPPKTA